MVSEGRRLELIAPIGQVPSIDDDLHGRLEALPQGSTIADVFREISKWEKIAVRKARERERTTKSGLLNVICK